MPVKVEDTGWQAKKYGLVSYTSTTNRRPAKTRNFATGTKDKIYHVVIEKRMALKL